MLSRFWYFLVAVAAGVGVAGAFIAQDQINRNSSIRLEEQLRRDRIELELWLRYDARARLDDIAPMAANTDVRSALLQASGRRDRTQLETSLRDSLGRKLAELNNQLQEGAAQLLFAVDKQGEIIAQLGGSTPPAGAGLSQFPVVGRAIHGYVGDDVWVYNDTLYRVAARPVIDRGQYVGAVVHCTEVSAALVSRLASRVPGASLSFFMRERLVASHVEPGEGTPQAPQITAALATALENPALDSDRHTGSVDVGEGKGVFALVTGTAAHAQVGYVITRPVKMLGSPLDLFRYEESIGSINWILVAGLILVFGLLGVLFMWLEVTRPLNAFRQVAKALGSGQLQRLDEAKLVRRYRQIGQDINQGIDRIAGSSAAAPPKSADLDQLLGDSSPGDRASTPFFGFAGNEDETESAPLPKPGPPAPAAVPAAPAPAPPPPAAAPAPPPAPFAPPAPAPVAAPPPPAPVTPGGFALGGPGPIHDDFDEDEGQTMVAQVPEELLAAAAEQQSEEERHFHDVFDQFVAMKRQCGEPTAGLTFERFSQTLRKNKQAIVSKHGAKSVRFTVYEKNGKAALKATPVKS